MNDNRMLIFGELSQRKLNDAYYDSRIFDAVVCNWLHKLFCRLAAAAMHADERLLSPF